MRFGKKERKEGKRKVWGKRGRYRSSKKGIYKDKDNYG